MASESLTFIIHDLKSFAFVDSTTRTEAQAIFQASQHIGLSLIMVKLMASPH